MLARSSSSRRRRQSRSAASNSSAQRSLASLASPTVTNGRRASVAVSASDSSSPRSSISGPSDENGSNFNRSPRGSIADSASDYETKRTSPRNSIVPEVKRTSPRNSLVPDQTRNLYPLDFNRSPRNSLVPDCNGLLEADNHLRGSRNNLGADFNRSPRHSLVPDSSRSPRGSLVPDDDRAPRICVAPDSNRGSRNNLAPSEFSRSPRGSLVPDDDRSPRNCLAPDSNRGSRNNLSPSEFSRSPRGSLVPDDDRSPRNCLAPDSNRGSRNNLAPSEFSRSPRGSLVPDDDRSPRNCLAPDSNRGSRNSLVPSDFNRSPRGSLVPDDDRSPKNCLAPESNRGSRNSLVPSDFNRSPRGSLVPEYDRSPKNSIVVGFDRSPRQSLIPDSNRSPRNSIIPEDCDRSPRNSLTPEPSRSPRNSLVPETKRISPRNSLIPEYDRSPRRSLAPDFDRSPRGSLVPDFNRSPRNSIIPDSTYLRSPRGSVGDRRSSSGSFGSADYTARGVSVIEPPPVAGPSHGAEPARSPSPYHLSVSARGAQINLGYSGSVCAPGSRRASSSVSQMFRKVRFMGVSGGEGQADKEPGEKKTGTPEGVMSADDRRRLCERSKLSGGVSVLRISTYGSFVYQLKDANMEASGSVDFVVRAMRIIYKTVGMTVVLIFLTTLPLLMLIMGVQFVRDCPREPRIPVYMVVGGCTGIVRIFWLIYSQIKSRRYERLDLTTPVASLEDGFLTPSAGSRVATYALNTFLLVWFVLGNYWIIHIYWPDFHSTLFEPNKWCSKSLYIFALIHLGVIYTLISVIAVGVILCFVCQLLSCPVFPRYK